MNYDGNDASFSERDNAYNLGYRHGQVDQKDAIEGLKTTRVRVGSQVIFEGSDIQCLVRFRTLRNAGTTGLVMEPNPS